MDRLFSLLPLERIARSWDRGGFYDEDFDESLLPFEVTEGVWIENVSTLISDEEFEIYKSMLGTEVIKHLERIKYAIIHRFERSYVDPQTNKFVSEQDQIENSGQLVEQMAACLRLIRPTIQHAQLCNGSVTEEGNLYNFTFRNPISFFTPLENQKFFAVRTKDIQDLRLYAPRFRQAFAGPYWKFRMAVDMFQSGYFQQTHWKARYFLWTAALESLFTTQGQGGQHSGSVVAKERVKFLLDPAAPIYPQGELTNLDPPVSLTVTEVIDEIYCLRNHIAHGDRVPDYYFQAAGRESFEDSAISRVDMLLEALSSIVRQSLLNILKGNLLSHFADAASSQSYFAANRLTRDAVVAKLGKSSFACPQ